MDGILAISAILLAGIWLSERIKRWREDDRKAHAEQQYQATVAVKYPRSEIGPLPESPRYDDAVPYNWVKAAGEARARDWKQETPEEEDYRIGPLGRKRRARAEWEEEHADYLLAVLDRMGAVLHIPDRDGQLEALCVDWKTEHWEEELYAVSEAEGNQAEE